MNNLSVIKILARTKVIKGIIVSISFLMSFGLEVSGQAQFVRNQQLFLTGNAEVNDLVGKVKLDITASCENPVFSILSGNTGDVFQINSSTGIITVKDPAKLSYATINTYELKVSVTCDHENQASVFINILDPAKTVYFDSGNTSSSANGSRENPYPNWDNVDMKAGWAYLFKRGEQFNVSAKLFQDLNGLVIGAYGSGDKPHVILQPATNAMKFSNCKGYVLTDLKLQTSGDRVVETYSENMLINNCEIFGSNMGIRGNGNYGKILYSTIHDVRKDGIYMAETALEIEIANCHFYNINMAYFDKPEGTGYGEATGDAVQLEYINCTGARIHHNIMDRSNTGHKFNLIINGTRDDGRTTDVIIEHNTFYGPMEVQKQNGSAMYINGLGLITRFNRIYDTPVGFLNRGKDLIAYGNILVNCGVGFSIGQNTMTVNNNTFYNNDISLELWPKGPGGEVKNNLIYILDPDQQILYASAGVDVSNNMANMHSNKPSAHEDLYATIFTDPKLVDAANGNFYLQPSSPAIDAGTNVDISKDIYGTPVPVNGVPDIGAYEYTDDTFIQPVNQPPVADAGSNMTVTAGTFVSLDGSNSSDPDGDEITYSWSAPKEITLSSKSTVKPTFTAPKVTTVTAYTFELTVNDGAVNSKISKVTVTVEPLSTTQPENNPPVAVIEADNSVMAGENGRLDGSASYDPDGDGITYNWTSPAGIELSSNTAASPTFIAPDVVSPTDYSFKLTVNDGQEDSDTILFVITIMPREVAELEEAEKLDIYEVTASTDDGNAPQNTLDSLFDTRWSAEGEGQWICYKLNANDTVKYIKAAWYKGDERKAYFDIQYSSNGIDWNNLYTKGETCGTTCNLQVIDVKNTKAQYVRIVGYGNSENLWNSILEVEIYGTKQAVEKDITSLSDRDQEKVLVYPNPVTEDVAYIKFNSTPDEGMVTVKIYNMTGKTVAFEQFEPSFTGNTSFPVNVSELINGIYISEVTVGNKKYITKFLRN
ncbi:MAG: PKD domain-containing protein [Cyclobacteriaceae bacterium]